MASRWVVLQQVFEHVDLLRIFALASCLRLTDERLAVVIGDRLYEGSLDLASSEFDHVAWEIHLDGELVL